MRVPAKNHPFATFSVWFLTVFLVLFPKGGGRLAALPLTWGYLFLVVFCPLLLVVRLTLLPLRIPLNQAAAMGSLLPFQFLYAYAFFAFGVAEWPPAAGLVLALYFLPFVFLFIFPPFLRFVDGERLSRYFRWCILIAALWGIFLFVTRPVLGYFIQVPYLTVNADDYNNLEGTKHIARGAFFKLISTYNNGNLYGVATLILLPMYNVLERVRWRRWAVLLALLLTLARTVWAGLIIAEALPLVVVLLRQIETFPVLRLGKAARSVAVLAITTVLILAALTITSSGGLKFLLDPTAGGRVGELAAFRYATWLPGRAVRGFDEIAYATSVETLGWAGFLAFSLIFVTPLLMLLMDRSPLRSPVRRAALHGMMIYAIIGWSDSAIVLIPVMAFYWFTYMIYLCGWPDEARVLEGRRAVARSAETSPRFAAEDDPPLPAGAEL